MAEDVVILLGDNNGLDFESPVYMTEWQRKKFEKFMKNMFYEPAVEFFETDDPRVARLGDKFWSRGWLKGEYHVLVQLDSYTNEEVADLLGRSNMSVLMQRSQAIEQLFAFAEKMDKRLFELKKKELLNLIDEFLKDREAKRKAKREQRKKENDEKKTLTSRLIRIFKSEENSLSLAKQMGWKDKIEEFMDKKKRYLQRAKELGLDIEELRNIAEKQKKEE